VLKLSWDTMDIKWGGRPVGGLLKKDALVKWGKTKGVTVLDLAEGRSSTSRLYNLLSNEPCSNSREDW